MTDKEMLELAAKGAGYRVEPESELCNPPSHCPRSC
jgi:hypothetical protein